ncbi:hypothetical protein AK812_SmicGene7943 [Symbiodinium microadriaticum]|uniref:Uncharacterized protein n=1 Tax=Symbiodinium microadriaticum TaxID=2951 RepID=A0A1Q9EM67_SYMMI|nr:hypothetical protein AK812_SmicGene7943 [Symbiodinium microadriaticum]CAE6952363.1 unnamed protein product [Symbiodinium sp. KB8]
MQSGTCRIEGLGQRRLKRPKVSAPKEKGAPLEQEFFVGLSGAAHGLFPVAKDFVRMLKDEEPVEGRTTELRRRDLERETKESWFCRDVPLELTWTPGKSSETESSENYASTVCLRNDMKQAFRVFHRIANVMAGSAEARAAEDITWPKLRPGIVSSCSCSEQAKTLHKAVNEGLAPLACGLMSLDDLGEFEIHSPATAWDQDTTEAMTSPAKYVARALDKCLPTIVSLASSAYDQNWTLSTFRVEAVPMGLGEFTGVYQNTTGLAEVVIMPWSQLVSTMSKPQEMAVDLTMCQNLETPLFMMASSGDPSQHLASRGQATN